MVKFVTILVYFPFTSSSSVEGINWQSLRTQTVLRYMIWDSPPRMEPHFLNTSDFDQMAQSGAAFVRQFMNDDPVLNMVDEKILKRGRNRPVSATVDKELPQPQNPNYTGIMSKTKLFSGCFALNMLLLILIPPFGWFILALCIAYFVKRPWRRNRDRRPCLKAQRVIPINPKLGICIEEDEAHGVFYGRRDDHKADLTGRCFVPPSDSGGAPASSSFGPVMKGQYGAFGAVTLD
ncbi:hypothetical protein FEM48_Zijuj10G0133000 [Ziziphus jujuba var. spinosa]|uniref:Uncharacterized protein n=1 Tax=Ziziphus jujuba var. spinosa TaxID=714518 RepID=A0A978UNL4_ZIZJJ|nr:hypothetical protein FEM48_Zijuj10G0133000 [Ziziphus jujuba var. spinosa]